MLPRAQLVPVGKDNLAHIEVTRDIVGRFNNLYGNVLTPPEALLSDVPTLPGIYGMQKMSKSLDNAILLSDTEDTVNKRVMQMFTDPNRTRADIPGVVEGNPVFVYHDAFNTDKAEIDDLKERYRAGKVGDVEVKKKLSKAINIVLEPMRERRAQLESRIRDIDDIIAAGNKRMREEA